jgi:hypothetical protein
MTVDLDAIEARADAATEGPWFNNRNGVVIVESHPLAPTVSENSSWGDAEFIAAARADIPALVAELRAAREVVEAAAQRIGGSHAMVCDAYALGPGTTCDCGRDDLAAALAAYRAVVGEA